ncbi:alpha-2-macroglobulin family protein [Thorsellia kenyensis]|uniref:Alpha-2-macroglobulin n=1 Tax=Thorsellia kenyensis TaxID=1549888 RepID=A0ABV6CBG2_9GAMM
MDILRLLVRLPFILVRFLLTILTLSCKLFLLIFKPILGQFKWQAPAWYAPLKKGFNCIEQQAVKHTIAVLSSLLLIIAIIFAIKYIYVYQENRPKPIAPAKIVTKTVSFTIDEPDYPDLLHPENKQTLNLFFSQSTAPIEKIEQIVNEGISLIPEIKGSWRWSNESQLTFTADEQFILGKSYTVSVTPNKLFAPNVVLESSSKSSVEFTVPHFYAEISEALLSNTPESTQKRQAFFTVKFPVPVDKKSFESAINLSQKHFINTTKDKTSIVPFTVKYDKDKTSIVPFTVKYDKDNSNIAYIQSDILMLEEYPSQLKLSINKSVKGKTHSLSSPSDSIHTLDIPDLFGLNVQSVETNIVEQSNKEQRLLIINLNDPIEVKSLEKALKVWLLPERTDNQSWSEQNIKDSDLKHLITVTPVLNEDEFDEDEKKNDNAMSSSVKFLFDAPENRSLFVTIDKKNIVSNTGYKLRESINTVVSVNPFTAKLNFTSNGAILPLKGSKTLDVSARNLKGMQVELYRIRPNQLQHMIWQKEPNYSSWSNDYDVAEHFSDYFTQFIRFDSSIKGKTQHHAIDLSHFLSKEKQFPRGIFFIKLRSWTGETTSIQPPLANGFTDQDWLDWNWYQNSNQLEKGIEKGDVFDQRIIVVTDIGIVTKRDIDQTWHVFAQSISQNAPLAQAKVSVIAKNGSELLSALSDENGHVHFPSLANFTQEQTPSYFLVQKETEEGTTDFSFLPVFYGYDRMIDFSRFDVGGNQQARDPKSLSSYLFSDRGVYRPGDTFHVGIITRTADWSNRLAGIPLIAVIYDARYQEIKRQTIVLNDSGFNELSYATANNSPTGEWRVELYLPGKNSEQSSSQSSEQPNSLSDAVLLGDVTINVKEFEPDQLKVKLALSPQVENGGWINPSILEADVNVSTLFNSPAENRRVTAQLSLKPVYPHFKRYDSYQFYENTPYRDGITEQLEEVKTDDRGHAKIKLNMESYQSGTYQLNLLVEAFELGAGRSVAATAKTLVSPYEYLIGFKQSEDLSFVNQGAERSINLIAIDPALEKITVSDLSIDLVERKYLSVLTQQASGAYQYESKLKETVINSSELSVLSTGVDFKLDTQTPGDYVLVIKNQDKQVLNRIYYSVAGNADVSRDLDRAAELNVKLDKTVYQPGDKMAISINAPYTGSGLITIERDKVYSWHWFHTDTTNSVQEITLPEMANFEGNAYVTVQFVRDSNSPEIFMSPLSYATVPFKLSYEARTAKLAINAPELLKSGDTLSMTVKTDIPQNVILFAVDEGILQVARYKLKDPLEYFFQKRALEVRSAQILDLILPEYTELQQFIAAAGGDASEGLDLHLNPFKRKKDEPVVFWSGIQLIDGEKSFDFPLPSYFSGKVRIMAISVSPDKIGHTQTESIIRDDIILSPNAPTTVAPNDEFEVSVNVTNNLDAIKTSKQDLQIRLETTQELELISDATQVISLEPNRGGVVTFRLKANQQLGGAELNFHAEYINADAKATTQSRTIGLSVRPLMPHRIAIQMGRMDGSQEKISNLRTLYPNFAENKAKASYSPLLLSSGLASYLNDYQHQCSEQIISRSIPLTVQQSYPEFFAIKELSKVNDDFNKVISILQNRQNSQGAIGLWQIEQNPDPFITAHAVMFMLEAKAANLSIPDSLLDNANRYLRDLSQDQDHYSIEDLRLRAYAAYLLAKQGEVVTSQIADIESRMTAMYGSDSTDLTALYLAATYQLLKLDKKAQQLLQPTLKTLAKSYDESWWNNDYWDPLVIDASRLSIIGEHFPNELNNLPPQVLDNLQQMLREQRFTTLSSAMTIIALDRYSKAAGDVFSQSSGVRPLSITSQFIDENKTVQQKEISTLNGMLVSALFQSTSDSQFPSQAIIFNNPNNLPAWYSVLQSGYDYSMINQPVSDGLEVTRHYTNLENKPITEVKLGETINVHVKIRANSLEGQTSIALVDLLPGGFEVVQQVLHQSSDEEEEGNYQSDSVHFSQPLAVNGSWHPNYTDIREDRVLIYGDVHENAEEFVYQIKATNIGKYQVPPAYAEAMYNRRIQAVSPVESKFITVTQAE